MSDIKPGDLVVVFRASMARKFMTHDYIWVDRCNSTHLALWINNVGDSDTGASTVFVLLNTKEAKGIYEFSQGALVHA